MRVTPYGCLCLNLIVAVTWIVRAQADERRPPAAGKPGNTLPARITEAVSAKLPKYVPPTPQPVQPADLPGPSSVGDVADDVFVLPDIRVSTGKLPPDSEYAFLTSKGRLELALKNNPGLRVGPFSKLNNAVAVEIQKQEREAGKRAELKDRVLSIAAAVGDDARIKEEIRLMRAATAQPNADWLGRPR